jgi:hypothetical protein
MRLPKPIEILAIVESFIIAEKVKEASSDEGFVHARIFDIYRKSEEKNKGKEVPVHNVVRVEKSRRIIKSESSGGEGYVRLMALFSRRKVKLNNDKKTISPARRVEKYRQIIESESSSGEG